MNDFFDLKNQILFYEILVLHTSDKVFQAKTLCRLPKKNGFGLKTLCRLPKRNGFGLKTLCRLPKRNGFALKTLCRLPKRNGFGLKTLCRLPKRKCFMLKTLCQLPPKEHFAIACPFKCAKKIQQLCLKPSRDAINGVSTELKPPPQ